MSTSILKSTLHHSWQSNTSDASCSSCFLAHKMRLLACSLPADLLLPQHHAFNKVQSSGFLDPLTMDPILPLNLSIKTLNAMFVVTDSIYSVWLMWNLGRYKFWSETVSASVQEDATTTSLICFQSLVLLIPFVVTIDTSFVGKSTLCLNPRSIFFTLSEC